MSINVTIPDDLAGRLRAMAHLQNLSVDELILSLLEESAAEVPFPTPEEVVAKIRATPPNPANLFEAKKSMKPLAEYLAASIASENPDEKFDLEEWQREWNAVEAEMKAIEKANALAEGLD
jgi:hypothetical protein